MHDLRIIQFTTDLMQFSSTLIQFDLDLIQYNSLWFLCIVTTEGKKSLVRE